MSIDSKLRCSCGRSYADRWRCECGSPLEYAERPDSHSSANSNSKREDEIDPSEGLWAFDAFIVVDSVNRVSFREGFTPLVDAPRWSCQFKLEYVTPTGSFKDRGATTTLTRAVNVDAEHVIEDSSGNAGAAIATYAARAGLDCTIYVPASVTSGKVRSIERTGASVVRVSGDGSREAVTDACLEAVEAGDGWYASHAWNPAFFEGTATFAYELATQRNSVPDAVVVPLGHGTLFLGMYRGFRALYDVGWTNELPQLLGVQAAGYDPITRELHDAPDGVNELADGIQIRKPVRHDQVLDAIEATNGDCITLGARAVETELEALHERGFYVEPTSAIAPAALRTYRDRGVLTADDDVVVPLTGSGLKT